MNLGPLDPARLRARAAAVAERGRPRLLLAAEILSVAAFAAWTGREFLDLRWRIWPMGPEFPEAAQAYYAWRNLVECGACVFWNGSVNGGAPAFVDVHSALLHPLVVATTLRWGVVNGTKVALVLTLAMGGLAQWWLARVLGIGRAGRLWSAWLAVAAGHVAGRMDGGQTTLAISAAASCLVYAPALALLRTGRRRATVLLALATAMALLAGHAYIQIGLALVVFPAMLIALAVRQAGAPPPRQVWGELKKAGVLTGALAAALIVPVVHFYPWFGKFQDAKYSTPQRLLYVPLNLVVADPRPWLGPAAYPLQVPYLYTNYVGWAPVILAAVGAALLARGQRRTLAFLGASIALGIVAAAGLPLRALGLVLSAFATGVRHPSVIASLVVPPILALAAVAVDRIVGALGWRDRRLVIDDGPRRPWRAALAIAGTAALGAVLVASIVQARSVSRPWLHVNDTGAWDMAGLTNALRTADAQWVQTPWGELAPGMFAFEARLKIAQFRRPWWINDHPFPPPLRESFRNKEVDPKLPQVATGNPDFKVVVHAENTYAFVETADGARAACRATATGGDIDVACDADRPGQLVVRENRWPGWRVERDGGAVALGREGQWLSAEAPAGAHRFAFRYRPWDAPLGLALSAIGCLAALWLWIRDGGGSARGGADGQADGDTV